MLEQSKVEMLFDRFERPLYYYALKSFNDNFLAEEAVQMTFIKLLRYIDRIEDIDSREAKGYVFAVHKSVIMDMFRKNKREDVTIPYDENVYLVKDEFDIDKIIGEKAFDGQVGDMIDRLSKNDQLILYLKYNRKVEDNEIADFLNLKAAGTVRQRLFRAKNKLAKLLTSDMEADYDEG